MKKIIQVNVNCYQPQSIQIAHNAPYTIHDTPSIRLKKQLLSRTHVVYFTFDQLQVMTAVKSSVVTDFQGTLILAPLAMVCHPGLSAIP